MSKTTDVRYASAVFSNGSLDDTIMARLETYEKYNGRIHNAHLSDGDMLTAFLQLHGDSGAAEEVTAAIERHPKAVKYEYDVDDDIRLYLNFEPVEWTKNLHRIFRKYEIMVDWPMKPTADSGLRFTIVGQEPVIKEALEELEADWNLSVERFGSYQNEYQSGVPALTARQQEILERAISDGYYDLPRTATQQDLAAAFDVSTATISEHLRKIESKVFQSVIE